MCFSASASFTACAVLAAAGTLSVRRAAKINAGIGLMSLSTFPLFFGIQQGFEGLVWLGMNDIISTFWRDAASVGFVFFAFFFWPVAGPVTGFLIEKKPLRKRIFMFLIPSGIGSGLYLSYVILVNFSPPVTWDGHLAYFYDVYIIDYMEYVYFITACGALILSSNKIAFRLGCVLAASFAFTMIGYQLLSLPSVWCFFAAICSLIVVIDLYRAKPAREETVILSS